MGFNIILKTARAAASVSQALLSDASGIPISSISFFENGRRVPRYDTAQKVLSRTGHRLVLAHTIRPSAVEVADQISSDVVAQDNGGAFRSLIQFSDDLVAEFGVNKYALVLAEPAATGDPAWDAALAAIVEYRFNQAGLVPPAWVFDQQRVSATKVTLSGSRIKIDVPESAVAREFLDRNLLIAATSLESV